MTRILIALALAVAAWAADPAYADVQPMIEQTIKMLEAKDADGVFALCVEPKQLEAFKADADGFAKLKQDFLNGKAATLLSVLKLTATATTTWDEGKGVLTFSHPEMERSIGFSRIDGHWYVRN